MPGRRAVPFDGRGAAARDHDPEYLADFGDPAQGREDFPARAVGAGAQFVRVAFDRAARLG
ncbi:MAG: hypothetical protein ACYDAB_11265 [bacterium]